MGIDWWEHDPSLSSRAHGSPRQQAAVSREENGQGELAEENDKLRKEIERLRSAAELPAGESRPARKPARKAAGEAGTRPARRRTRPEE
jgi:hypothetical protein